MKIETNMPWSGNVSVEVATAGPVNATLAFRIPGWSNTSQMKAECGSDKVKNIKGGYIYISGIWNDGDKVELDFPMEIHMVSANTRVREDIGKVAFTRGPISYCMEEVDNGKDLHMCRVDMSAIGEGLKNVKVEKMTGLGHEVVTLLVPGKRQVNDAGNNSLYNDFVPVQEENTELKLVPYYVWNNRGEGEMSVWIRY